jgi:ATP-dependent DNA helicase RecQ
VATIYNHLTEYISSGEVDILDLVQLSKFAIILEALESQSEPGIKGIKERLGDAFGYDEIRAVSIYRKSLTAEKAPPVEQK